MTAEIEEVDIEVGFIVGSSSCSLELEEDDLDVAADE
uniref:Precursor peptide n=1 Tax=Streptomyces nobilis TaxID=66901 RepID=I2CME1_9ACTN|nr:precursor peptide [Streptomyces nobilis]